MAVIIEQRPLYPNIPVGQEIIFTVSDDNMVATTYRFKFVARLYVKDSDITINTFPNSAGFNDDLVGVYKVTPNNKGKGIFNFTEILESLVQPDNEPFYRTSAPNSAPSYKSNAAIMNTQKFPIHIVDKLSLSENSVRYFALAFYAEYAASETSSVINYTNTTPTLSNQYQIFNGVVQYDDVLTFSGKDFGFNMEKFMDSSSGIAGQRYFLTNSPLTQYAKTSDYGTLAMLNRSPRIGDFDAQIGSVTFTYYSDSSGSALGSDTYDSTLTNGGYDNPAAIGWSQTKLMYVGCFPANLRNWSTFFNSNINNIDFYTIQMATPTGGKLNPTYTIRIKCDDLKGYESIRLAWLNQWGTWDYYTFDKKSTKSLQTSNTNYTELKGSWNDSFYRTPGFKGGRKNFRVNTRELVKINSDYITEDEAVWFEELIQSNEVYIVNGFSTDTTNTLINKYVEPVQIMTKSYTKKTIANDKLIQYTFEIEKSRTKRAHKA